MFESVLPVRYRIEPLILLTGPCFAVLEITGRVSKEHGW